ncbi:MAG TPA: serine O-acetyltransferase, partial [Hyphomicrobiaceae bacterium]|nr:serine O-acetyltransferase [Hyphomicrobiaceae bacterium]
MASKSRLAQRAGIAAVDPIWEEVREEAEEAVRNEPALGGFVYATILSQARLEDAVCHRLAQRLNHSDVDAGLIGQTFTQVLADLP